MTDPLIELMGRILTHIPDEADINLVILKGHLIIEEELNECLSLKVTSPSDIQDARLSFNQLMFITKAHYKKENNAWCWGALKKLNKVRNSLSHNLEPEDLYINLTAFIELIESQVDDDVQEEFNERLRKAIAMLAAQVHGLHRAKDA